MVPNLRHFPPTIRSVQVINAELRIGKELNLIQIMMKEWFYTTAVCTIIALMFFYGCILCLVQMYLSSKHHHRSKTNEQFHHQQRHWSQNLHGAMTTDELFQNYPNQSHGIIVGETDTEFDDFYGDDFEPDDLDSFHDSQSQISSTKVNKSLLGSEKKISITETTTTTNLQSKVDDENNKSLHKQTNTKEQMKKTNSQMHNSSHSKYDHDDEMNKIGIQRIMSGEFEPYEVFTGKKEDF